MKLFNTLSKLMMMTLFISLVSISTTFFMFNLYAERLIGGLGLPTHETKLTVSDLLAPFVGQVNRIEEVNQLDNEPFDPFNHQSNELLEGEALEVWNQHQETHQQRDSIVFSADEFNHFRDQLSEEDKMIIFSLIISNVPAHEVQKLSHLMEDGISEEDITEMENVMRMYLDEEDYDQLIQMFNGYN